jgi:hypothetical protein
VRPEPRIALLALALLSFGCKGDPRPLGWELEFDDSALRDRATVVEAVVLEGSCDGEERVSIEVVRGELSMAEVPVLADGRWCFVGRARDSACTVFAEGVSEVDLPALGPVVVVMTARASEVPACSSTFCDGGRCGEAAGDGGVEDRCTAVETVCDDGMDNDCNGDTDCADDACVSDPVCEACVTVICAPCEVCRGGDCFPADDETACAGGTCWGGSCCTGCFDGISCRIGDADAACGSDGARCQACEGCGTCGDGACVAEGIDPPDGTPCASGAGLCASGVCCSGCLDDGGGCQVGDTPAACGLGGLSCGDCGECGACSAGSCVPADGTPCAGGSCRDGLCCGGCWDGSMCQTGTAPTACGEGGELCSACISCQRCTAGSCSPGMNGDMCTSASMQPGLCVGTALQCCAGCWDGSSCQPGNTTSVCGTRGNTCQDCVALSCKSGFCR